MGALAAAIRSASDSYFHSAPRDLWRLEASDVAGLKDPVETKAEKEAGWGIN